MFGQAAEPEQEPAVFGSREVQWRQRADANAAGGGGFGKADVVGVGGQGQEQLHPRGGPADLEVGESGREGLHEQVAAPTVDVPRADNVLFIVAARQQAGQRELIGGGRP